MDKGRCVRLVAGMWNRGGCRGFIIAVWRAVLETNHAPKAETRTMPDRSMMIPWAI